MSDMPAFAAPFAQPAGSPIRELFPYLSQPGMISLAGGYPSPSLFDAEGLAHAAAQAMMQQAEQLTSAASVFRIDAQLLQAAPLTPALATNGQPHMPRLAM